MRNLFGQEGPVMRAISDLSTLVFLNILTVIFCIPIVTAGASLAAMHYVIMEMIEERGGPLVSEFWKRFRENLRNATPVWLILLAAAAFLYADQRIIAGGQLGLPRAMLIPIYVGALKIGDYFNTDGIIQVVPEDIKTIIETLSPEEEYYKHLEAIEDNYRRVQDYYCFEDWLYKRYGGLLNGLINNR